MCYWFFSDIYTFQSVSTNEAEPPTGTDEPPGYSSPDDHHHGSLEQIPMRAIHNGRGGPDGGDGCMDPPDSPRHEKTIRKGPFVYREWVSREHVAMFLAQYCEGLKWKTIDKILLP